MADFPATRLSVIERIREGDEAARKEALGIFVEDYRPALIDFLVKAKRVDPADADDLVSDFILNKIMQGKVLELANGEVRFRGALRTCIQRYLIDSIRKKSRDPISTESAPEATASVSSEETEVDPLDRVWATGIFTSALSQMKQESPHWELFVDRVLTQPPIGYDEILKRSDYASPQKASNALMTAKRTFNRILSACLEAQSLTPSVSGDELDDEARLLRILLEDTELVRSAVDAMANRDETPLPLSNAGTIGTSMVFLDASADATWQGDEITGLFADLLNQSLDQIGLPTPTNGQHTLRQALDTTFGDFARADLISLKNFFNQRGKSGKSDLPRRIDVAMTFAVICRFALTQGRVEDITSMTEAQLVERVRQLSEKNWVPQELKTLFGAMERNHDSRG